MKKISPEMKQKIAALPLWLRVSLAWGWLLFVSRHIWMPLFAVHWQRYWVFWWAGNDFERADCDSLDAKARRAVESVLLQPSPVSGVSDSVKLRSEFED